MVVLMADTFEAATGDEAAATAVFVRAGAAADALATEALKARPEEEQQGCHIAAAHLMLEELSKQLVPKKLHNAHCKYNHRNSQAKHVAEHSTVSHTLVPNNA
jgi:hypothetical protein